MTDLLVERVDRVLLAILNRPETLNALTVSAMSDLGGVPEDAGTDAGVGAIVITGAGEPFASGGDVAFLNARGRRCRRRRFGGPLRPARPPNARVSDVSGRGRRSR